MLLKNKTLNINLESLLWLPKQFGVFWKDTEGYYLGCSDTAAEKIGLSSRHDVVGRTDFDLSDLLKEEAVAIQNGDKKILQEKKPAYFLYSATALKIKHAFLTFKAPLLNQDKKMVGIYGIDTFIDVSADESTYLETLKNAGISLKELRILQSKFKAPSTPSILSKRQIDCLFCLVKGMTIKEIAIELQLSPKTVEHYLTYIRFKLNCHSRSQLISKALKLPIIKQMILKD